MRTLCLLLCLFFCQSYVFAGRNRPQAPACIAHLADKADSVLIAKFVKVERIEGEQSSQLRFEILEALKGPLRQKEILITLRYEHIGRDYTLKPDPILLFVRIIDGTSMLMQQHVPLDSADMNRCITLTREYLKIKNESKDVARDVKQWLFSKLLESKPDTYFQRSFAREIFLRSLQPTDWTYSNEELDRITHLALNSPDYLATIPLCLVIEKQRPHDFERVALHTLLTTKALQLDTGHNFSRLIASSPRVRYAVINKLDNDPAAFENGFFYLTNYLSETERCEAITHLWIMNSNRRAYLKDKFDYTDPHGNSREEGKLVRRLSVSHPLPLAPK